MLDLPFFASLYWSDFDAGFARLLVGVIDGASKLNSTHFVRASRGRVKRGRSCFRMSG